MGLTLECLTAVVCVLGLVGFLWWLLGRILRPLPVGPAWVLLQGRGDGIGLEQTIRGFMWLRSLGVLKSPILIANVDLNREGYELALRLATRWPGVILWPAADLGDYLAHTR